MDLEPSCSQERELWSNEKPHKLDQSASRNLASLGINPLCSKYKKKGAHVLRSSIIRFGILVFLLTLVLSIMSVPVETGEVLSVRRVWLTTMQLLGFDESAYEEKFKVVLARDMFSHINKKGSEVVLHFLFTRLDSHLAYEEFRDCWPIFDKKQEAQFRKACSNWLAKIAKEEPTSRLPRLASSLLLSPGGDKFYHFLLRFSSYVLKKVCLREAKPEDKQVSLSNFVISPESHSPALKDVSTFAIKAHTVRHTNNVIKRTLLVSKLHREWEAYASELADEYRSYCKEEKQLTKKLNNIQEQRKQQLQASTGTPKSLRLKASEKMLSLSAEVADQKRQSRMDKVRNMWHSLQSFHSQSAHQREVVDTVLQERADIHSLDAKDIVFQVSAMLLPEYEALSREEKIRNTYHAGKLDLVSLIQLWNCSLKKLRDKLREKELPSFEAESRYVNEALHTHRANLTAAKNLRVSLSELQSSLEASSAELEEQLVVLRQRTPSCLDHNQRSDGGGERATTASSGNQLLAPLLHMPPIAVPSLGLDLLPPSPKKLLPASPNCSAQPPVITNLSLRNDEVATPEAVNNISQSVHHASRQRQSHRNKNPQQLLLASTRQHTSKLRAPQVKLDKPGSTSLFQPLTTDLSIFKDDDGSPTLTNVTRTPATNSQSSVSTPVRMTGASDNKGGPPFTSLHSQDASALPNSVKKKPRIVKPKVSKSSAKPSLGGGTMSSRKSPQVHLQKSTSGVLSSGYQCSPLAVHGVTAASSMSGRRREGSKTAGVQEDKENVTPLLMAMPKAHDILADQIAAAVAGGDGLEDSDMLASTPEPQVQSLADPISAMGTDAFVPRDKIPRTPVSKPLNKVQGLASSPLQTQSLSPSPSVPQSSNRSRLQTPKMPSDLAVHNNLSTNLDLSSCSHPANTPVSNPPTHISDARTPQDQELTKQSPKVTPSSLQNPLLKSELESQQNVSLTKSSPPQLVQEVTLDSEQLVETPPSSQHSSMNESYSPVGERGDGESESECDSEDEGDVGERPSSATADQPISGGSSPPRPRVDHERSSSSSGNATPNSSILQFEPMSGQAVQTQVCSSSAWSSDQVLQQHTDARQSPQSNTLPSKKVLFSTNTAAVQPPSEQCGLFSPGSINLGGTTFQTPPSTSSYQLMSELPPTPFQDANFDLDSSSDDELEEENKEGSGHSLPHKSASSMDSSYFGKLQGQVEALIIPEGSKASSQAHEDINQGSFARVGGESQPKLVDIDESPSCNDDFLMLPSSRKIVDSAGSLKVDDLLSLKSPSKEKLPSPLEAYHLPRVGVLVDIGTPGSDLATQPPLLSSTMQGKPAPTPNPLPLYLLPTHSGTQSGALLSGLVDSGHSWPSLQYSGSPFLMSPPSQPQPSLNSVADESK